MKKVIRLTESDLTRIVKRVIKEQTYSEVDEDIVQQGIEILNRKIPELFEEEIRVGRQNHKQINYVDKKGEVYFFNYDQSKWQDKGDSGAVVATPIVTNMLSVLGLDEEYDWETMHAILEKWLEDNTNLKNPIAIPFYR
jgi:hypothetical protein